MFKFKNVDIISALRKIVDNNNYYYKTDLCYDIEKLQTANANEKYFLFLSRESGTYFFNERDIYVKDTYPHNTWLNHSERDRVKAFSVEVTRFGAKPVGNIFEIDYELHREHIRANVQNPVSVTITYQPPYSNNNAEQQFGYEDYIKNSKNINSEYGKILTEHYNVGDEEKLAEILNTLHSERENAAVTTFLDEYITAMKNTWFRSHGYDKDDLLFMSPVEANAAANNRIDFRAISKDRPIEYIYNPESYNKVKESGYVYGIKAEEKQKLNIAMATQKIGELLGKYEGLQAVISMALSAVKNTLKEQQEQYAIDDISYMLGQYRPAGTVEQKQDLDYSENIKWLCDVIKDGATNYENNPNGIYFDYEKVFDLLCQTEGVLTSTARCPRPIELPSEMPWCESMNSDEFDPDMYNGSMSADEHEKMYEFIESENYEREGFEP
ncbi:MAG: hypothetical protein LBC86_06615 [Oscillospiraceae bacterium]|jgi:hypothetical protein|nr:hypothetical protein [Oscillospiraceae bacterium]